MAAVTFDAVVLQKPSPYTPSYDVKATETVLLSGKRSVQSTTEVGYKITYSCFTATYSNVTDLSAKIGVKKTLVDDFGSRSAYISAFSVVEDPPDIWTYTVSFIGDSV